MKTRTILLLLSAAFFCAAHHARAIPWNEGRFDSSSELEETAAAPTLRRSTRSITTDVTSLVEQVFGDAFQVPTDIMQRIVRVVRAIIDRLERTFGTGLEIARSTMGSLVSEGASLVNPRRRRETLSELVPDVVQYPLDLLQRSVDTARNFATDQIGSIAGRMVSAAWKIVTTVVIPWLHRAAEQLEKSNDLPATLRTLLGDFDYAYTIFQTLGYIGPRDS